MERRICYRINQRCGISCSLTHTRRRHTTPRIPTPPATVSAWHTSRRLGCRKRSRPSTSATSRPTHMPRADSDASRRLGCLTPTRTPHANSDASRRLGCIAPTRMPHLAQHQPLARALGPASTSRFLGPYINSRGQTLVRGPAARAAATRTHAAIAAGSAGPASRNPRVRRSDRQAARGRVRRSRPGARAAVGERRSPRVRLLRDERYGIFFVAEVPARTARRCRPAGRHERGFDLRYASRTSSLLALYACIAIRRAAGGWRRPPWAGPVGPRPEPPPPLLASAGADAKQRRVSRWAAFHARRRESAARAPPPPHAPRRPGRKRKPGLSASLRLALCLSAGQQAGRQGMAGGRWTAGRACVATQLMNVRHARA